MNLANTVLQATIYSLYLLLPSNIPGQGLLDSIAAFITGPFGKAITLIAIVRPLAYRVKKCKVRQTHIPFRNRLLAGLLFSRLLIQPENSGNRFRVLDGSF